MKPVVKRVLKGIGAALVVAIGIGGIYATVQASAFNTSMEKVYDVPLPHVERSTDPAVLARGQHLSDTLAGCGMRDCHGADLSGGRQMTFGPLGRVAGPNITPTSVAAAYSDAELARLVKHGIKKDGRSVRFMPVQDFGWLPDSDVAAIVSYVRTVAPSDRPNGTTEFKLLAKILDRKGMFVLDVARHIDHTKVETPPPPAPTAAYGGYIARLCLGCHGEHLSGGPIPGAPPSMPIPTNITPHETGLKDWTYEDFARALEQGVRKNGTKLNSMMPFASLAKMDDTEKHALWAYLQSVPPLPFGSR